MRVWVLGSDSHARVYVCVSRNGWIKDIRECIYIRLAVAISWPTELILLSKQQKFNHHTQYNFWRLQWQRRRQRTHLFEMQTTFIVWLADCCNDWHVCGWFEGGCWLLIQFHCDFKTKISNFHLSGAALVPCDLQNTVHIAAAAVAISFDSIYRKETIWKSTFSLFLAHAGLCVDSCGVHEFISLVVRNTVTQAKIAQIHTYFYYGSVQRKITTKFTAHRTKHLSMQRSQFKRRICRIVVCKLFIFPHTHTHTFHLYLHLLQTFVKHSSQHHKKSYFISSHNV